MDGSTYGAIGTTTGDYALRILRPHGPLPERTADSAMRLRRLQQKWAGGPNMQLANPKKRTTSPGPHGTKLRERQVSGAGLAALEATVVAPCRAAPITALPAG